MIANDDLWPDDLAPEKARTPHSILRQQAEALAGKTQNRVRGRVDSRMAGRPWHTGEVSGVADETVFRHRLILVVPYLEDYEVDLLSIYHGAHQYPVIARLTKGDRYEELADEAALLEWLRQAFRSAEARSIMSTLLSVAS